MHGAAGSWRGDASAAEACAAVERLVMERRAGRTVGPEGCAPLAWELLLTWEARQYAHEAFARSGGRWSPVSVSTETPPCDAHVFVGDTCKGCGLKGLKITVGGVPRIVAPPKPGFVYNGAGELLDMRPPEERRRTFLK